MSGMPDSILKSPEILNACDIIFGFVLWHEKKQQKTPVQF